MTSNIRSISHEKRVCSYLNYKLSIIIPTYNAENYLTECIESVINQTMGFKDIELIIVDDASIDNTPHIIKNFANKYQNIMPIFLDNNSGFPGKPRNIGLKKASADFIMFMDNDDILDLEICEKLYNIITHENVDLVLCKINQFDQTHYTKRPNYISEKKDLKIDSIEENRLIECVYNLWAKLYRKNLILDNNILFIENYLNDDLFFSYETFQKAQGIYFLTNYYGYNYRVRTGTNASTVYSTNKHDIKDNIITLLKKLALRNDKHYLFTDLIVNWTILHMKMDLSKKEKKKLYLEVKPLTNKINITAPLNWTKKPFNVLANIFVKIYFINFKFTKIMTSLCKPLFN